MSNDLPYASLSDGVLGKLLAGQDSAVTPVFAPGRSHAVVGQRFVAPQPRPSSLAPGESAGILPRPTGGAKIPDGIRRGNAVVPTSPFAHRVEPRGTQQRPPLNASCAPGLPLEQSSCFIGPNRVTTLDQINRLVQNTLVRQDPQNMDTPFYGGGVSGTGDVEGPDTSTDNAVARFDGTTGKLIQNSGVVISDGSEIYTTEAPGSLASPLHVRAGDADALSTGPGSQLLLRGGNASPVGALDPGGDVIINGGINPNFTGPSGQVRIGTTNTQGVTVGATGTTNTLQGTTTVPATDLVTPSLAIAGDVNTGVAGTGSDALSLVANGNYGLVVDGSAPGTPQVDVPGFLKNPIGVGLTPQGSRPGEVTTYGNGFWVKTFTQKFPYYYDGTNDLVVSGALTRVQPTAKVAAYTVAPSDQGSLVRVDASGGAFDVTLPAANSVPNGFSVWLARTDATSANTVNVLLTGADTLDGFASSSALLSSTSTNRTAFTAGFVSDGTSGWYSLPNGGLKGGVTPARWGGTGLASYTVGDLLYANATNTLAALADVATGNALISGGVGVAPSWGKIGLTTHISGTLPIANGGTNGTSADAALENVVGGATELHGLAAGDMVGLQDVSAGTPQGRKSTIETIAGYCALTNEFRLTGVSATPVMTADSTAISTLYFTPYLGNRIGLWDNPNSKWVMVHSAEVSLAISGRTTDLPFDVFAYVSGGAITLEALNWSTATVRATALVRKDGVWSRSGADYMRYIGTVRPRSATTCHWVAATADSPAKFDIWNYDNRVMFGFRVWDTTNTWTYTTATWRQARASTNNQVDVVVGLQEDGISLQLAATSRNSTISILRAVGIGVDSTSTPTGIRAASENTVASRNANQVAFLSHQPGIGRHFYAWLEWSTATGTCTWVGDDGSTTLQSGMTGYWRC